MPFRATACWSHLASTTRRVHSAVGQNISDLVADVPEDSGTGSFREPQTLRQIIVSLQKFMEIQGRMERFLSDDKYKVSVV